MQAAEVAHSGQRGEHGTYPEAELLWLATAAFNYAVDLLLQDALSNEPRVTVWMDAALSAARWTQDNGTLHKLLTVKRQTACERVAKKLL